MDLFKSAFENDIQFLQSNLDYLGRKDIRGKTLLHYAVLGSAVDVVDFLLSQEIDTNIQDQSGETALFDCARKGKLVIAKKLISKYAKLDIKNNKNENVLHLAAHKGDLDMVKLFVENGCPVNERTIEGKLPIHYAILAGHRHIVEYLLEVSDVSMFTLDSNQNTFLHYAARTTNVQMIKYFLDEKLDPNQLNDSFETPLFLAVHFGTKETVKILLEYGAYIEIKNRRFETPKMIAKIHQAHDIYELLISVEESPKYKKRIEDQLLTVCVLNRDYDALKNAVEKGYRLKKDQLNLTALDYAIKYKLTVHINLLRTIIDQ